MIRGLSESQFRDELSRYIKRMFADQKAASKHLRVSPSYLNDVLQGRRAPGKRLLDALFMKREVRYTGGLAR
jgi:hypothetical protein